VAEEKKASEKSGTTKPTQQNKPASGTSPDKRATLKDSKQGTTTQMG